MIDLVIFSKLKILSSPFTILKFGMGEPEQASLRISSSAKLQPNQAFTSQSAILSVRPAHDVVDFESPHFADSLFGLCDDPFYHNLKTSGNFFLVFKTVVSFYL